MNVFSNTSGCFVVDRLHRYVVSYIKIVTNILGGLTESLPNSKKKVQLHFTEPEAALFICGAILLMYAYRVFNWECYLGAIIKYEGDLSVLVNNSLFNH